MGRARCNCSRVVCALAAAPRSCMNVQVVQDRAERVVPNWSQYTSAREGQVPPLVCGDWIKLGSQAWSYTALSADAAVDIFMTNRPLRFFTGMKSKCL